jgi:hypothetical protein
MQWACGRVARSFASMVSCCIVGASIVSAGCADGSGSPYFFALKPINDVTVYAASVRQHVVVGDTVRMIPLVS